MHSHSDQSSEPNGDRSTTDLTSVHVLDGVECCRARLTCQGVYVCEFLDQWLLEGCKRHGADEEGQLAMIEAELKQNKLQYSQKEFASVAYVGIILCWL
jgi:hypothetical protein